MNQEIEDIFPSRGQLAVIVSGVVSMGLEILAGRVLAPRFGSSVYTWGTIIGVSMLALSIGYARGGRTSENITYRDVEKYLAFTSLYILSLVFFGEMAINWSADLVISSRYAVFIPATVLFGPPTYFLGYISPYAAQLSSKDSKGGASGHFYAIGTMGSIIGVFATTFLLIPYFTVDSVYLLFASLSLTPLLNRINHFAPLLAVSIMLVSLAVSFGSPERTIPEEVSDRSVDSDNVVYSDSTLYSDIEVVDENGVRTMNVNGRSQSATYIDGREGYAWSYPRYFHMPFLLRDDIDKALFIGGGGFVSPQKFAEQNITAHAVELDSGVVRAAEKTFNLSESEDLKVYTMDGRKYVENTDQKYDMVVIDAYRRGSTPAHLTTKEFYDKLHGRLDENGSIVLNTVSGSSKENSKLSRAQYKTISSVFDSSYYFELPGNESTPVHNIELVGSKTSGLTEEQLVERSRSYTGLNLTSEVKNLKQVETEDVPVLRDDYAPVSRLVRPIVSQTYSYRPVTDTS